ncbi:MAG: hypothetical protein PHS19_03010 [Eubacteriales bacterium]|nr:hypothetical protein [Eubacteriales bacterium]
MQDLFSKLSKVAGATADTATNKVEEFREVNKLKGEQSEMKTEYSSVKRKLADYVFKKYQEGELEDETLKEFCEKMQSLRDSIDQIDEDIKEVKKSYQDKAYAKAEEKDRL